MPEYLAPGVYVEETSFRQKTIEGVSTSIAGFIGPARYGPIGGEPELLTSFSDFERIYGGIDNLIFNSSEQPNYVAHAVRAFFDNGGSKLYVTRIFEENRSGSGVAQISITSAQPPIKIKARFPGNSGNMQITFLPKTTPVIDTSRLKNDDVVYIKKRLDSGSDEDLEENALFKGDGFYDVAKNAADVEFKDASGNSPDDFSLDSHVVHLVTLNVIVKRPGKFGEEEVWENFSPNPQKNNALNKFFKEKPNSRAKYLTIPFFITINSGSSGAKIAKELLGTDVTNSIGLSLYSDDDFTAMNALTSAPNTNQYKRPTQEDLYKSYDLTDGDDGSLPLPSTYKGREIGLEKTGLETFFDVEEISIVAAPGFTAGFSDNPGNVNQIAQYLITHCEKMRYRIAVLDAPANQTVSEVRDFRSRFDSKHAALYYPWVKIMDPTSPGSEVPLPPSGYVTGIYARNDVEHGVHKAPANEIVRGAVGFENLLNKPQQDVLNPDGINCFRYFEGRGFRLWGARTITSDPEWKYVNLRRYFAFLERSIEKGTQWVVFENNSEPLWANVRRTVDDFLFNEWKSAHLMGEKPQNAYFVRCDRSTMTQNDIDNGRLICLIGVAPVRPAEFVIFRIGQKTAD